MKKQLYQNSLSVLNSNPHGSKIVDGDSGDPKDTGVQTFAEVIAHFLMTGIIEINEPIIIKSNMENGAAIQILDDGGSGEAVSIINEHNQFATLGIGGHNKGIVANEFVPHPAFGLTPEAANNSYGNTGRGTDPSYGAGPGGSVETGGATGPYFGQQGGTGGGGGAFEGGWGFQPFVPGMVGGTGPSGIPGGGGTGGSQTGGSGGSTSPGGGTGGATGSNTGTGYNPPGAGGSEEPFPGGGSGNPGNWGGGAPWSTGGGLAMHFWQWINNTQFNINVFQGTIVNQYNEYFEVTHIHTGDTYYVCKPECIAGGVDTGTYTYSGTGSQVRTHNTSGLVERIHPPWADGDTVDITYIESGTGNTDAPFFCLVNDCGKMWFPDVLIDIQDTDDLPEGTTNLYATSELIEDIINSTIQDSSDSTITWTYNDPAGTLTPTFDAGLDDLNDITLGTPVADKVLAYNGTIWEPTSVTSIVEIPYSASFYDNGNSGSTPTISWENGPLQQITLNATTVTPTFSVGPGSAYIGAKLTLKVIQDSTAGRVWNNGSFTPGTFHIPNSVATPIQTSSGSFFLTYFMFDGTNLYLVEPKGVFGS